MRVCILTHTFPRYPGDTISSIFMEELAHSFVDSGNEVWVLTPYTPLFKKTKKDYKIVTYRYIYSDSLHRLGYSETLNNDMGLPLLMWLLSPFMYFFGFLALLKLIKKEKIQVVNAHWILPNGFIATLATLFTGVKVVSTLPGSDVYMANKNILFNILARIASFKSNWITSNSPQLIIDLEKATDIKLKDKSSVIVYGVGSSRFKPDLKAGRKTRKLLGFSEIDKVILGVGRLVEKKGFEYLIKAAPKVIVKNPKSYFVLIGDGEQKEYLEALCKKLKVINNFRFLGSISYSEINNYYNMADVFILPSIRDSKGNLDDQSVAVIDAMTCGKPIITTNFPGYKTVIEDGVSGFLTGEKDFQEISQKINLLLSSKTIREKIGASARRQVLNNFSWKTIGKQYSDLFTRLLNKESYSKSLPSILNKEEREKKAKQIYNVIKYHLKDTSNLKCLDVGCSDGTITHYLSNYFKEVAGIDVDKEALTLATKNYQSKNLKFSEMPGEKIIYPSNYFDVVVANQIYEFVDDDNKTMSEIYRVLKKGGICFFGARNKYSLIEAQYKLPFLSFLPRALSNFIVVTTGKGSKFIGNYRDYGSLKKLVKHFKIHDYTLKIIRDPEKYGFIEIVKYKNFAKILPLDHLLPITSNYIWILEKK